MTLPAGENWKKKDVFDKVGELGKHMERSSDFNIIAKQVTELLEWKEKVTQWCIAQELARQNIVEKLGYLDTKIEALADATANTNLTIFRMLGDNK